MFFCEFEDRHDWDFLDIDFGFEVGVQVIFYEMLVKSPDGRKWELCSRETVVQNVWCAAPGEKVIALLSVSLKLVNEALPVGPRWEERAKIRLTTCFYVLAIITCSGGSKP